MWSNRGFREKLRKFIAAANKRDAKISNNNGIDEKRLRTVLTETLKQKLDIFSLDMDSNEASEYMVHVSRLSGYVARESGKSLGALTRLFTYDYPRLMALQ